MAKFSAIVKVGLIGPLLWKVKIDCGTKVDYAER
jgi:hypothetical protein